MARDGMMAAFEAWRSESIERDDSMPVGFEDFRAGFLACRRMAVEACREEAEQHRRRDDPYRQDAAHWCATAISRIGEERPTRGRE